MTQFAEMTNTTLFEPESEGLMYSDSGARLDNKTASQTAEDFWTAIGDAFQFSRTKSDKIDSNDSIVSFLNAWADSHLPSVDDAERRRRMLQFASLYGMYVAGTIERQSLKFFWLEDHLDAGNAFVADTYEKIMHQIAASALSRPQTKLELFTKVLKISSEASQVSLTTNRGQTRVFDEVVVTSPLGWLQRHKDSFNPPLPLSISTALDNLTYGNLDKVYIAFPQAFWQPVSHSEPHFPFASYLEPKYAKSNPRHWFQSIMNLAALDDETAQPTLMFYITADTSNYIADLAKTDPLSPAIVQFFEPYYSRLPNYNAASVDCQPTSWLATTWTNDEFAGHGSYTNFQVGSARGPDHIITLRHGMPDRNVWFAGEHTAPLSYIGTTTGAWWSGTGVARRILDKYGILDADVEELPNDETPACE